MQVVYLGRVGPFVLEEWGLYLGEGGGEEGGDVGRFILGLGGGGDVERFI